MFAKTVTKLFNSISDNFRSCLKAKMMKICMYGNRGETLEDISMVGDN